MLWTCVLAAWRVLGSVLPMDDARVGRERADRTRWSGASPGAAPSAARIGSPNVPQNTTSVL
eukprot:2261540-Prymnesium_polylepis.1